MIFLTADAFGVLPPVSILTDEQTQYHFLSGFTAKLAGTERGIKEPQPTFSACFGAAFLSLHPTVYADVLLKRMKASNAKAYLVNTGWNGAGKRISLKDTRTIINAILDDSIHENAMQDLPVFNLQMPLTLKGLDISVLDPRSSYPNAGDWTVKATDLAKFFRDNFAQYTKNEKGAYLAKFGPDIL